MQNYNPKFKSKKGFTLIELLVVMTIIGLLASIVAVAVNSTRKKARDVKRRADLKEVQLALEIYSDANNGYPMTTSDATCPGGWCGVCSNYGSKTTSGTTGWVPNLAPTYLPTLPTDSTIGNDFCYLYRSDSIDFKLLAHRTVENCTPSPTGAGVSFSDTMYDPARAGQCTFTVYTTGAVNW